jgi:hypothetical protein
MTDASDPYAAVIGQAATDPAYRSRLIADPLATMQAAGMTVPDGVAVKVVENTDTLVHLVLPPAATQELTDQDLEAVAGGVTGGCIGTALCLKPKV